MRRNKHRLKNTKAQKFGLERGEWCKYAAFAEMYDSIQTYLIDSNVATKLDVPVWMDRDGNVTTEDDAFGCKVTIKITRPDMILVGDEVGSNVSMAGDKNAGGTLYLCEKGSVPQKMKTKKDKHITLMGLTNLLGDPVCCIVIIEGKVDAFDIRYGIDFMNQDLGSDVDLSGEDIERYVRTNKKAIIERGWATFNRNLLLNTEIRATMIESDVLDEKEKIDSKDLF
jgi:hypothetical protein